MAANSDQALWYKKQIYLFIKLFVHLFYFMNEVCTKTVITRESMKTNHKISVRY